MENNKIKIVQILYSGLGGHGSVAFSLLEADEKFEFDHALIFYGIENVKVEYKSNCDSKNLEYCFVRKEKGTHLPSFYYVYKCLKKLNPQIILLHSVTLVIPVLIFSLFNSVKVIAVEHNANNIKRHSEWLWSIFCLWFTSRTVYLTNQYKNEVKQKLKLLYKDSNAVIIPNGINPKKYCAPSKLYTNSSSIRLCMIGRFTPLRDFKTFLDAIFILKKRRYKIEAKFAGDGETRLDCENYSNNLQLSEDVSFLGILNETGLVELLRNSDIYVHSTFAETMSTSIMQAMMMGLPIIASDLNGIKQMEDNFRGEEKSILFFETQNAQNLSEVIIKLIENPELRKLHGNKSLKIAHENFASSRMFLQYKKLIDSIV